MRVHKHFAQGELSDKQKINLKFRSINKDREVKKALTQCRTLICQFIHENEQLKGKIRQKDTIIDKLIQQKQEHILHMSSCNSENLIRQLQAEKDMQNEMKRKYQNVAEKYEIIIKKSEEQMNKLKSFNRALRIQNSHLREQQDNSNKKSRKVGSISTSSHKKKRQPSPFEVTQINSLNQQQIIQNSFSVITRTPEPMKSIKSTNLPSTEHSKDKNRFTEQRLWKSKELPKSLFNNHALSSFKIVKESETEDTYIESHRQQKLNQVIRKISDILASSDDESL